MAMSSARSTRALSWRHTDLARLLTQDHDELANARLNQFQGEGEAEGGQETHKRDWLPYMKMRMKTFGLHLKRACTHTLPFMTLDEFRAFFVMLSA